MHLQLCLTEHPLQARAGRIFPPRRQAHRPPTSFEPGPLPRESVAMKSDDPAEIPLPETPEGDGDQPTAKEDGRLLVQKAPPSLPTPTAPSSH